MATASDSPSNVSKSSLSERLICPICMETYKSPRALSCLHTFCSGCLQSYILKKANKEAMTPSIPCPLCRRDTTPSDPTKPPSDWVKQLPLNYAILPALESDEGESESRKCDPCLFEEKTKVATSFCRDCGEYICKECVAMHTKFSMFRGHMTVRLTDAQPTATAAQVKLGGIELCAEHNNKQIEFYCKDHQLLCCSTCAILGHRACQQLVEVKEMGKDSTCSSQGQKLKDKMVHLKDQLVNLTDTVEANVSNMEKETMTILQKVEDFRDKIVGMLDKLVLRISTECSQIKKANTVKLNDQISNFRPLIAAIASSRTLLESVLEHGTENQKFIMLHKLEYHVTKYENMVKEAFSNSSAVQLQLDFDRTANALLNSQKPLAEISVNETSLQRSYKPLTASMAERKIRKVATMDVKKTSGFGQPGYTGLVALPGGQLVAVDQINKLCCLLDDDCKVTSCIKLASGPCGLALTGDNEVIVTLRDEKQLLFLSVLTTFTLTRTIKLSREPVCVTSISNTELAVGYFDSGFGIITLDGEEKTYKDKDTSGRATEFVDNGDIVADRTGQNVYQSCYSSNSVCCIKLTEEAVWNYTHEKLGSPRCMTLDRDGNVLVCSEGTNTIHQISPAGELIRVIDLDIDEPYTICFYPGGQQLLVMSSDDDYYTYKAQKIWFM